MGRVVVSQFITVDGVVEDPGGVEQFERGGWALKFDRGEDGDKFKLDEVMASDALLLGRRTYEGFDAAWPLRTGEFADRFNTMPKYVVSTSLQDPGWSNTTMLDGDFVPAVRKLKQDVEGDILVNGSVELVQALVEHSLLDELRLMVFPTLLGAGKRLFSEAAGVSALRLTESRPAGETVILVYEPAAAEGSREDASRAER